MAMVVLLTGLSCAGCLSIVEPSPKVKVVHSPLPPVSRRAEGSVVLREAVESYRHPQERIGAKVLGKDDWIVLLIPIAHPKFLFEIEGSRSLNQVLTGHLAETLEHAGYTVQVQAKATKPVPKKGRDVPCVLEFTITEFDYEYRDSGSTPNSHTVTLDLRLLRQRDLTLLWHKQYHTIVKSRARDPEDTIREAMDEVLCHILADVLSEAFRATVKSGRPEDPKLQGAANMDHLFRLTGSVFPLPPGRLRCE